MSEKLHGKADRDRAGRLGRLAKLERELACLRDELVAEDGAREALLPDRPFKVLRFTVGDGLFAISIEHVREAVRYVRLIPMSGVARAICGVMNVRGAVVPVLDVRLRLRVKAPPPGLSTPIMLVDVRSRPIGLLVDRLVDVVVVRPDRIQRVEGPMARAKAIFGVVDHEGDLVQLVDPVRLMNDGELEELASALAEVEIPEALGGATPGTTALEPARSSDASDDPAPAKLAARHHDDGGDDGQPR